MCGFISIFDASGSLARSALGSRSSAFDEALERLRHRGPDDGGTWSSDSFVTGFRRLSIIDTSSAGHQPMVSDDGRFVLSFNGEIYNFLELREQLASLGHVFRTKSDSEVLLASYAQYGADCVRELRGMFAFTIWDTQRQELVVARDRLGIKPLFHYSAHGAHIFASELKAIVPFSGGTVCINHESVFKYLARGWVDDTAATFRSNVTAVRAATVTVITRERQQTRQYWSIPVGGESRRSFDAGRLRESFFETVNVHLRCDVPWAATLSGGMDSTAIVATAARLLGEANRPHAFSVIPPHCVDESPWIDATVRHTGVQHAYLDLVQPPMVELIDEILWHHDEPFQTSSCIYQYLLRKLVAQRGFKVLLVGEGGDEVFGGYRRLFWPYLYELRAANRMPEFDAALRGARDFLGLDESATRTALERYATLVQSGLSGQENVMAYRVLSAEACEAYRHVVDGPSYPVLAGNKFYGHLQQHLLRWDIPYVLRMEDRNSMAHGIESRVPFLDHCLIEEVFSHDFGEFMREGVNKAMLRKAMRGVLPDAVVDRKSKSPRPGNDAALVYGALKAPLLDLLARPPGALADFTARGAGEVFARDCETNNQPAAEYWFRYYLAGRWLVQTLR